jgi:hypothetical protein
MSYMDSNKSDKLHYTFQTNYTINIKQSQSQLRFPHKNEARFLFTSNCL